MGERPGNSSSSGTVEVKFFATLQRVVGAKTAVFELAAGATVRQLLDEMIRRYPLLKPELLDDAGNLYSHVHIFVNGRDAAFLADGLENVIPPAATIGVFPAVAGG